jgi:transcriptional regulator with XRE-family HTH domain
MEKNNLSAREFSKRTGISYNTVTDWKRKGTNPSADKIMDICYVLKVTPETILIGHGYDKALDDPLIFDKLQDPQERRLLESYRILSNKQRKLLWQYMEVLSQLTPKKTEPFDSDIDIES